MSFDNFKQSSALQPNPSDRSQLESPQWEANRIGSLLNDGDPQFSSELSVYANALKNATSLSDAAKQGQWTEFLKDLSTKSPSDVHVDLSGANAQVDIDGSSEIYVTHAIDQLSRKTGGEQAISVVNQLIKRNLQPQDNQTFVADFNRRTAEQSLPFQAAVLQDSTTDAGHVEITPLAIQQDDLVNGQRAAQRISHLTMNGDAAAAEELSQYMNDLSKVYGSDQAKLSSRMGDLALRLNHLDPVDFQVTVDDHGQGHFDFDMTTGIHVKHSLSTFNESLKSEFLHSHDPKGAVDVGLKHCNDYIKANINSQDSPTFVSDFNRRSAEMGIRLEAFHGAHGLPEVRRTSYFPDTIKGVY